MRKHDDNACSLCGMNKHWARACRTPKHFMDLYQASIKEKGKRFETYFTENAYDIANIEVNNALMEDIPTSLVNDNPSTLTKVKSLDFSDFFEDPDGKLRSSIGEKNPNLDLARLGICAFHL